MLRLEKCKFVDAVRFKVRQCIQGRIGDIVIGIIGAMDEEVSKLKDLMTDVVITSKASMEFYRGKLKGKDVTVVKSGIGKVNAGICAHILAEVFQVDCIINTGIAGSLNADINIGDLVFSTDAIQHDVDAVAFGYEVGQIPRMDVKAFPADNKLLMLAQECSQDMEVSTFAGRVTTGDQFIASKEKKEWIVKNFGGYCTEMEGAAIAQAAYLNHVPFLIIRAISDKADDSAHMDYSQFEAKAIEHSVLLLTRMIEKI